MKYIKHLLKKVIIRCNPMLRICCIMLFRPKYLRGRYFEESIVGWQWVWRSILTQKIMGFNRHIPWPVSPFVKINNGNNMIFNVDDLNNFQTMGCYFQNQYAKIIIGEGTLIAPNVGIITANHSLINPNDHLPGRDVVLGKQCWIGMNSVILPGVILGDHTVVGAGSVVTKSVPEGNCVIAGIPAKIIKKLNTKDT